MHSYTNKFNIFMSEDKTEVLLNFYQNTPSLPESGQPLEGNLPAQLIPVASMAMTGKLAENLAQALGELLNK
ncbi:hypothetical protein [Oscillibacter sp.]|uniref:hypothetical protein n=1 Tax=Oscillibacter sp. TaxID=1945593 RepID=UPI0028A28FD1|nr:hypothetical protein [Oscillibacter sp.]